MPSFVFDNPKDPSAADGRKTVWGVTFLFGAPVEIDDEALAAKLRAMGFSEGGAPKQNKPSKPSKTQKQVDYKSMKAAELRALVEERGAKLSGYVKKTELVRMLEHGDFD